jgi:hypothetical protein
VGTCLNSGSTLAGGGLLHAISATASCRMILGISLKHISTVRCMVCSKSDGSNKALLCCDE